MSKLTESMEIRLGADLGMSSGIEQMIAEWGGIPASHLSVVLVHLRFLYFIHQTHHWVAKGDTYYGDHLLFQRLYEGVAAEIDLIAEKAIGTGCERNVNVQLQTVQLLRLVQGYGSTSIVPQPAELARRSLQAERNFLMVMAHVADQMKETGQLSRGVDNLLAGIEDKHEEHIYLLKQRTLPV